MATTGGHIETLDSTGEYIKCFSETINLIELKLIHEQFEFNQVYSF
jgi:hypothetical protein